MGQLVMRAIGVGDGAMLRAVTLLSVEEAAYAFGGAGTLGEELARTAEEWEALAAEFGGAVEAWRGRCAGYFVMEGERVCGKLLVYFGPGNDERAYMSGVWVDPLYRRRGVGKWMVEEGLAWARGKGAGRVWLWVDATNPGGAAFYERLGFAATGKVRAVREGSSVVERGYEVLL